MYMFYSNQWLWDFLNNNWMGLVMLYSIVRSIFPNSKVLVALGMSAQNMFPSIFKREEKNDKTSKI
jgi:membrane-bound metal-dependent hydrolase YbcI (DUF457 family)